jgi:hypothetical protein
MFGSDSEKDEMYHELFRQDDLGTVPIALSTQEPALKTEPPLPAVGDHNRGGS